MKGKLASFLIASCAASAGVTSVCAQTAQNVYRCGTTYSSTPCAADASVLDAQDSRTPEQRAQTAAGVQKEAKLAKTLEKERLQREAQERAALRQAQKNQKKIKTVVVLPPPAKLPKTHHRHRTKH